MKRCTGHQKDQLMLSGQRYPKIILPLLNAAKFVAIDFETANQNRNSACAIGITIVEDWKVVHQAYHLIRPPQSTFQFTYIHGIQWKDVAQEPSFDGVWSKCLPLLEGCSFIAAHNAPFDKSVLAACCQHNQLPIPRIPFLCTVRLAKTMWPISRATLPDVCEWLDLELDHHNAASDAEACARIVIAAQKDLKSMGACAIDVD